MGKQVIVVVHGVGVREAGVATDLLASALDDPPAEAPPPQLATLGPGDNPGGGIWLPHSSDDFLLRELSPYDTGGRVRTFGARLRRYRRYGDAARTNITDERVVADFYWGDISGTGTDVATVLFGFLRVLFGLSHAVRENLASAFPAPTGFDRWVRALGALAVLTIHGPIFALNLVLLGGMAVVKALVVLSPSLPSVFAALQQAEWAGYPFVIGALAVLVGAVMLLWITRVYLMRLLSVWIVLSGGITLLYALIGPALGCYGLAEAAQLCAGETTGMATAPFLLVGMHLMEVMVWFWGLSLFSALIVGILCLWFRADLAARQVTPFALPAVALMMLLWFAFAATVWAAVLSLASGTEAEGRAISASLASLPLALAGLLALVVTAGVIHLRKAGAFAAMAATPALYMTDPDALAEKHRLIVGRGLLAVLTAFLLAVLGQGLLGAIFQCDPGRSLCDLVGGSATQAAALLPVFLIIGTLVIGPVRRFLVLGVDILTDVLVYLNDHSWDSQETPLWGGDAPNGLQTTVFLERWLGLGDRQRARAMDKPGFWARRRIGDRLRVLMTELIRNEVPDDIIIVSHSQGTVIAMDMVDAAGPEWRAAMAGGGRLRLITMGSPYTHLYNRYFPRAFPPHHTRPNLRPTAAGGVLEDWHNIFRLDDFVGTHIDAPRNRADAAQPPWPAEHPVPPGGHTHYWTDVQVIAQLQALV